MRKEKLKLKNYGIHFCLMFLLTTFAIAQTEYLSVSAQPTLELTVATNKLVYGRGETVAITGNLTLDGVPVTDGVVAIQVNKPNGSPMIVRASTTGSITGDWSVEVLEVFTSDYWGNRTSSFKRGVTAYINIALRNNRNEDKYTVLILNLYDSAATPFEVAFVIRGPISPGELRVQVSYHTDDAPIGTITVYANAFSELPNYGGYAYSPEKSTNFNITTTTSLAFNSDTKSQTAETTSISGTYYLNFRLPQKAALGNYTVYTGAYYQGQQSTATSSFEAKLIGDINLDGKVDGKDIAIAAKAYGTRPGQPLWDARADLNLDGKVDGKDIAIISKNFGQTA